jgi:hypothetical protein
LDEEVNRGFNFEIKGPDFRFSLGHKKGRGAAKLADFSETHDSSR